MMKGSNVVAVGAIGFMIGMLMIAILGSYSGVIPRGKETVTLIEECQKTLPRNAECVIVAVPETEIGD